MCYNKEMSLYTIPKGAAVFSRRGPGASTVHPEMHDILFVDFHTLGREQQIATAQWLHQFTEAVENMLTVETNEVAEKHLGIVALRVACRDTDKNETPIAYELAGFIGASQPIEGKSEVGTLCVDPAYRKQQEHILTVDQATGETIVETKRLSSALVYYTAQALEAAGIQPYAFCNDGSLPVFRENGFVEVTLAEVPKEASDICKTSCKLYNLCRPDQCCDTPVIKPLN